MENLNDYTLIFLLLSPLFCFIVAVSFRLLDNSALLFLQKEILIDTSNVSVDIIKSQINSSKDHAFKNKLKRALLYRKLHRLFLILMIAALPLTVVSYFFLF